MILKFENWSLWTVCDFTVHELVFFLSKMISSTQLELSVKRILAISRHDSFLGRLDRLLVKTHFRRSGNLPTPLSEQNTISRTTTGMSTGGKGESATLFQVRGRCWARVGAKGKLSGEPRTRVLSPLQVMSSSTLPLGNLLYSNKL